MHIYIYIYTLLKKFPLPEGKSSGSKVAGTSSVAMIMFR